MSYQNQGQIFENPIEDSLTIVTPSWGLQNIVAVNPFWYKRSKHCSKVFYDLGQILNQSLMMPVEYYENKRKKGEITDQALQEALAHTVSFWETLPKSAVDFDRLSKSTLDGIKSYQSFAELLDEAVDYSQLAVDEVSKFCAAYFDKRQAYASYPWQSVSFWHGWHEAQSFDQSMTLAGIKSFARVTELFKDLDAKACIEDILNRFGIHNPTGQSVYMQRLLSSVLGWASQFKYVEWQKDLGYKQELQAHLLDLLAVRMIYDYALFVEFEDRYGYHTEGWTYSLNHIDRASEVDRLHVVQYTLQLAYEYTYQSRLVSLFEKNRTRKKTTGKYQMVFCIDVRSEMLRRHIEKQDNDIQTMGFAGFFGVRIAYHHPDHKEVEYRLPALLPPAIHIDETKKLNKEEIPDNMEGIIYRGYFKNLRKASMCSYLYVELFGILALGKLAIHTVSNLSFRLLKPWAKHKFDSSNSEPCHRSSLDVSGNFQSIDEKVEIAQTILTHLGLKEGFGRLVVLCGHGASTVNNAQASALDCGACGGHPGDINAKFVAGLLNDEKVRALLQCKGIAISEETWFVAGIHETVTDQVKILDEDKIPSRFCEDLTSLKQSLKQASLKTSHERTYARSRILDPNTERRTKNWSEVRPEWGLSGNASFVIAPRARTQGLNLSSRSFLHDYDWSKDDDFKTLELIMTAPMVVTNWINLQYFASVTAPDFYSSGNKLLQNVTGEHGVVEGNNGDLRFGLSEQSVFDGVKYTHEPLRLSVFIEAPKEAVEHIISSHQVVQELVENEWLHILLIDPQTGDVSRRKSKGLYQLVD